LRQASLSGKWPSLGAIINYSLQHIFGRKVGLCLSWRIDRVLENGSRYRTELSKLSPRTNHHQEIHSTSHDPCNAFKANLMFTSSGEQRSHHNRHSLSHHSTLNHAND
jgi:hypothetical protein